MNFHEERDMLTTLLAEENPSRKVVTGLFASITLG